MRQRWGTGGKDANPLYNSCGSFAPRCSNTSQTSPVHAQAHQPTSFLVLRLLVRVFTPTEQLLHYLQLFRTYNLTTVKQKCQMLILLMI